MIEASFTFLVMSFKSTLLFDFALVTVAFGDIFVLSFPLFAVVDFSMLFAFSFGLPFFCWPFGDTLVLELFAGDFFFVSDENSLLLVAATITFDLFATLCDSVFALFTSVFFVILASLLTDDDDFCSSVVLLDAFDLFVVSLDFVDCWGLSPFYFGYTNKTSYCYLLSLLINIWVRIIQKSRENGKTICVCVCARQNKTLIFVPKFTKQSNKTRERKSIKKLDMKQNKQ